MSSHFSNAAQTTRSEALLEARFLPCLAQELVFQNRPVPPGCAHLTTQSLLDIIQI